MHRKTRWLCTLLAMLLILPAIAQASGPFDKEYWKVNIRHDLSGGQWPASDVLYPRTILAKLGQSMHDSELQAERSILPQKKGATFLGWSVRFTNPENGSVIYDSGEGLWDLNHPFDYYPNNPQVMDCLMTARFQNQGQPESAFWQVNIRHDLSGGSWPEGNTLFPHQIQAEVGKSMPGDALNAEKWVKPHLAESTFLGWSVRFTNPKNGSVIYDSGEGLWDLNHPFDYYPDNPPVMDCLMTARFSSSQSGGNQQSAEILADGRALIRPFPAGMDPLPAAPPPADTIIKGTKWITSVMIVQLNEGDKAPVYAFPAWNGPLIDWVGLEDNFGYGLYLADGWVMLYHPRWVASSGIGFIASDVVAFPGAEEGEP